MQFPSMIRRALRYIIKGIPNKVVTTARISYLQPGNLLAEKKIIVTGGGRGLGLAMARKFISEGAEVLISGRKLETLEKTAAEIGCRYLQLDMQNVAEFPDFIRQAANRLGGINCLVNNAGISLHEDGFLNVSCEQWDAQFNTNLRGPFFLTQEFVRFCQQEEMESTKKIIFISSETSTTVDERPYGLTKCALNSLIQGLAYRYVREGYRINGIAPGITVSDMTGIKTTDNLTCGNDVTGRYYLPEEVAEIAAFLLSDLSNTLNGQILVTNEGKTINARWR